MTATALARSEGVRTQTVSRWRRGERPDDLRLPSLATTLRVPLNWLKTGHGERGDGTRIREQPPAHGATDGRLQRIYAAAMLNLARAADPEGRVPLASANSWVSMLYLAVIGEPVALPPEPGGGAEASDPEVA